MTTTLKLQLMDSSDDGCVCIGDIISIPYNTPEDLLKSIYGTDDIGVPADDIKTGLDENDNLQIEINLFLDKNYSEAWHNGLVTYNKICGFLKNTETNLASTQYRNFKQAITDEEAESIVNGEMINSGTNAPMHDITHDVDDDFDCDIEDEEVDEKTLLQNQLKLNNDAQDVLMELSDLIEHLKDEDTFNYIYQMMISEHILITNDMFENNCFDK